MNITVVYEYEESYLPTKRHRIPRWRNVEGETVVTIKEVSKSDAPVAFIVNEINVTDKYHWVDEQLWVPLQWKDMHCDKTGLYPISELVKHIQQYSPYSYNRRKIKQDVIDGIINEASRFIIIDGIVCRKKGEPRYVLMTFGLGCNHGGTSLMIDNYYNSNISKDRYYNALDREQAIADAKAVAKRRGDTKHLEYIGESWVIEVLMPEAVKCNPQKEHGDGDPFLNKLYSATENSANPIVSMLMVATTVAELKAV